MKSYAIDARPEPPADWTPFVRTHGSFYHEPEWAQALASAFGFRPTFLTARSGRDVVGVLPLVEVRSLLGKRRLVSLPFSYAAGPATLDPEADLALSDAALALARERGIGRVELKRLGTSAPVAAGFTRTSHYSTFLVSTAEGEEGLWPRLHAGSTRRGIRKAEREGVSVERAIDEESWRLMATLQAASSHGHGLPAPPSDFFAITCRALQAKGLSDLSVARSARGAPLGAIVLWKGARSWIYAFGASRAEALELRPNHALLWRAMRDATEAGVGFDLGRAAAEQAGLVQFKERWGGVATPLAYDYSPTPTGLNVAPRDRGPIAWVNRAWSALPAAVAARGSFLYRYLA
jgi:hypothetical protein